MKLLLVGSGGREHAIAWRLRQEPVVEEILVAPGNPGTEPLGRRIDVSASDLDALLEVARREAVDLTIAGPEAPLVSGIADRFADAGLLLCGPSAAAARLEGSKIFAKEFMLERGIPTAAGEVFDQLEAARAYLLERGAPVVVKADGLAAGKGVYVCESEDDAIAALETLMRDGAHGGAGRRVVIEELLEGEEASIFCLTDGERYQLLPTSQDHKRLEEGDRGPMTGGMGAVTPAPIITDALLARVAGSIIEPTLAGLRAIGAPYRGFLYFGLMIDADSPRVLEYNCRLGDPEAQVVLPLVEGDLAGALHAAARGELEEEGLHVGAGAAACIVIAAPGYPSTPTRDLVIDGAGEAYEEVVVFHAGTARRSSGELVTAGGRVLGVTGRGPTLEQALDRAYRATAAIHLDGMQYRRDIGHRALARLTAAREVNQV